MTDTQKPEALRLAEELDWRHQEVADCPERDAAAELRLLHTSNEQLAEQLNEAADEIQRLQAENELLHARCQQAYTVGRESGREDDEVLLRQALDCLTYTAPRHDCIDAAAEYERMSEATIDALKERLK